jgi:hypothetical protein
VRADANLPVKRTRPRMAGQGSVVLHSEGVRALATRPQPPTQAAGRDRGVAVPPLTLQCSGPAAHVARSPASDRERSETESETAQVIREDHEKSDVAIKRPKSAVRPREILRSGRCPSHARPLRAKRRALVVLADRDGRVLLFFRLARIDYPRSVLGADGKRYANGCELIAVPATMRRPGRRDRQYLSVSRYPEGAISYFDARSWKRVVYDSEGAGEAGADAA